MPWFKHNTNAIMGDCFIQDLMEKFGLEGYGFWFATIELLAQEGKGEQLIISWEMYGRVLRKKRKKIEEMLSYCRDYRTGSKIEFDYNSDSVHIKIPAFRKYANNYIRTVADRRRVESED
jgi:hypothetical protein